MSTRSPLGQVVGALLASLEREQQADDDPLSRYYGVTPDHSPRFERERDAICRDHGWTPQQVLRTARDRTSARWVHFSGLDYAIPRTCDGCEKSYDDDTWLTQHDGRTLCADCFADTQLGECCAAWPMCEHRDTSDHRDDDI